MQTNDTPRKVSRRLRRECDLARRATEPDPDPPEIPFIDTIAGPCYACLYFDGCPDRHPHGPRLWGCSEFEEG